MQIWNWGIFYFTIVVQHEKIIKFYNTNGQKCLNALKIFNEYIYVYKFKFFLFLKLFLLFLIFIYGIPKN